MFDSKNPQRTPISELGEFGLIDHLVKNAKSKLTNTALAMGDDAGLIDHGAYFTAITTDLLVEGVHFDLSYMPLKHLGYKSVVVNLSDIYAMNGTAEHITVGIAVSNRFPVEALEEIYEGIHLACERYNVDLIGGDTTASTSGLMISITATGRVEKAKATKRSGAKDNDLIVISGDVGGAYMGLQILEREKQVFIENPDMQPELGGHEYILERQLKPEARKDIVDLLHNLQVQPTSMIDISDGLSSEILHLSKASNHQFNVYENKIPIDPSIYTLCEEFNLNTTTVGLNGGEDYELLFTISIEDHDKIKANPNLSVIGYVKEGSGANLITRDDKVVELKAQGFKHHE
ncbi:thiamine-phosphate kinase [Schleiferiaceae bacterium]|jgi:thiamine-monophosphate kinase|nr:thiamine-phosphate kinase [Schleiferiaceae bacterium]MDB2473083.1 thiamine-phosphate kinase [Schleiferiaceae bacterium]